MKIAVAGGCGGIGRALVDEALARGHEPVVLDLPASLERHPPNVPTVPMDATDIGSVTRAFGAIDGQIDAMVNLCGFTRPRERLLDQDEAALQHMLDGNLMAAWRLSRAARPLIAKGGAMLHVASGLGTRAIDGYGPYALAKSGMIMLVRQLATELAPDIRVNAVAPSAIDTAFLYGGTGRSDEDQPAQLDIEAYTKAVPLKRIGEPRDVVGPILFLISDEARYITGQTLHVNGGLQMP